MIGKNTIMDINTKKNKDKGRRTQETALFKSFER